MSTRPPERRRVLGSTTTTGTTSNVSRPAGPTRKTSTPTLALGKPLKARVDPSCFATSPPPTTSPIIRSPTTTTINRARAVVPQQNSWQPSASASSSYSSAPSTPQTTHFARSSPSLASTSHQWSNNRAPSPASSVGRARSPDRPVSRPQTTTPRMGDHDFITGSKAERHTLDHLPAGVSVRKQHQSPRNANGVGSPVGSSSVSSSGLSSSPGVHSPTGFNDLPSNGYYGTAYKRPPPAPSNGNGHSVVGGGAGARRASHGTTFQTMMASGSGTGEGLGLLPAMPVPSSPTLSAVSFASRSLSPLPFAASSSPTFSDLSSRARPSSRVSTVSTSKPPSVRNNSNHNITYGGRPQLPHKRNSSASSVAESLLVSDDGYGSASRNAKGKEGRMNGVEGRDVEEKERKERRDSDEIEKDARVERRVRRIIRSSPFSKSVRLTIIYQVLDLEIRNASLLSVNASLEVLKLRQTQEIRDLRRRLRESRSSLAPLSAGHLPDEGSSSEEEDSALGLGGKEDDEDDAAWEDVLHADEKFQAVATLLEALIKRGKDAVAYHPSAEVGRVLHRAEMDEESSSPPSPVGNGRGDEGKGDYDEDDSD
ncbi:hypothetical protein P7C70_g4886, partial [Phenoliferia sp. Uapishka_3]